MLHVTQQCVQYLLFRRDSKQKKSDITITLVALNYCTSGNLHFSVKLFYSVSDPDLYSILVAMLGEELCQFWGSSVKKNIQVF